MSLLHRISLLQKFLILGTVGLLMSLLPTWLYVNDSLNDIAKARHEAQGAAPLLALQRSVSGGIQQPLEGRALGMALGPGHRHRGGAAHARSYQPLLRLTMCTTSSITGTSISTPTTVASAAPE